MKMKKNYSVLIKAYALVVVTECKDEKEAMSLAECEVTKGDFVVTEWEIEEALDTNEKLADAKRHADLVI